jgi:hypothetical protein
MIPHAMTEWWAWRKSKIHANMVQESLRQTERPDYLEIVQIVSAPFTYKIATFFANRFTCPKKKVLVRWFVAYITHRPALLVLAVCIAAYLSCLFQIILLNEVRKAVPILEMDISNLESLVTSKITNATNVWINGTNTHIGGIQDDINDNLLGWARTSSSALNNTLTTCTFLTYHTNDSC